jgi:hypothetical protein
MNNKIILMTLLMVALLLSIAAWPQLIKPTAILSATRTYTPDATVRPDARVIPLAPPPTTLSADAGGVTGTTYYVSKSGHSGDGRSWITAWNDLDQINWNVVLPGDTIVLDGGSSEVVYTSTLTIGRSGDIDNPITIKLASEPGHDGRVVIDGGLTYWPCQATGASPYTQNPPPGTRQWGLDLNAQSWIVVDGGKWGGIEIRNHTSTGVRFHNASHIRLSNLHIHHNTFPDVADGPGISISGDSIVLEKLDIHNDGQDAIQGGNVTNLVLQDSYLHDHYCSHPDGIQLFKGANRNLIIRRNVFANGLLQAIFLGEQNPALDSTTSDVEISYNVIHDTHYGIVSNHHNNQNWKVYNNTIVDMLYHGIDLYASGGGMEFRNNILYNASYVINNGVQSNNIYYQVPFAPWGENGSIKADPLFLDKAAGNYQLQPSSPGIDTGYDVGLAEDNLGHTVPMGKGVDIGAFEFDPTPATPTSTATPLSDTETPTSPTLTIDPATPSPTVGLLSLRTYLPQVITSRLQR